MVVWGSGGDVVRVAAAHTALCPICEKERPFSLVLQYEYTHVYFLFAYVTKRQYFLLCDTCQKGQPLDRKEVEQQLERVPIPFMRRFGCLVLLGLVLVLFLIGMLNRALHK